MNEHEPRQDPEVTISFGETEYSCTPENTSIYTHGALHRDYDHIFLVQNDNPDEEQAGVAFFRETIENFDEVMDMMHQRNFSFVDKEVVSNFDKEMYQAYFGRDPKPAELPTSPLTPRQEKMVSFLAYALEHDQLAPKDFTGTGDLYL